MRKKSAVGLVILMLCSLIGCGKKDVDYSGATESANGEVHVESQTTVAQSIEIPENIEYTITGSKGTIEVAAEIKVPEEYEKCTVMELSRVVYEDEDIKTMADKIFDEGSYFLYMPYNEEARANLRDKLTTASENAANEDETKIFEAKLTSFNDEENLVEIDETYEELKFYPDHRKEDIEYFCQVFGTIDGRGYLMTFEKDNKNSSLNLRRWDSSVEFQLADTPADGVDMNLAGGNSCTYSQEECEELAREFVKKLGYDKYDVAQTNNAHFAKGLKGNPYYEGEFVLDPVQEIDGYNVYLGRSYNDYFMVYSSENWISIVMDEKHHNDEYHAEEFENTECVRVYVDSQGICDMKIYNPLKEEGPLSEEVGFLPFDKVDSIAQDEMKTYTDANSGRLKVVGVELGYGIVEDEGKKALIPVWYYFANDPTASSTFYQRNALFMINALDGTVITYE